MTGKDRKRLHILLRVCEGRLKQREAGEILGVSARQIKRLLKRLRREGDAGVLHRSRGKASHNSYAGEVKDRVMDLYREKYAGFGPGLAAEKLAEEGIRISDETVRLWLKEAGIKYPSRRLRPHRSWRKRKSCPGEMIQMDGSHHDWLEGRGPRMVLMGYIDDATNEIYARFYTHEGTFPAFDSFLRYTRRKGLPCSVYLDRHTTYKSNRNLTEVEELAGVDPYLSEFERAMKELGVEVIHAYSPQAKGRVERLFRTLQDRLIKEMRLRNISTLDEANRYLATYLPIHNKKYRFSPENETDLHRRLPTGFDLRRILCLKTTRLVRNDFTVSYKGHFYQLLSRLKRRWVDAEEWLDGSLHFRCDGSTVPYKVIQDKAIQAPRKNEKPKLPQKPNIPPTDHPWRNFTYGSKDPRGHFNFGKKGTF